MLGLGHVRGRAGRVWVAAACQERVGRVRGAGTCPGVCVEQGASEGAGGMSERAGVRAERAGHMQRAWGA